MSGTPHLRAMLKSVVANWQFLRARCHQTGWVQHPKCIFCLEAEVTGKPCVARLAKQRGAAKGGGTQAIGRSTSE